VSTKNLCSMSVSHPDVLAIGLGLRCGVDARRVLASYAAFRPALLVGSDPLRCGAGLPCRYALTPLPDDRANGPELESVRGVGAVLGRGDEPCGGRR
jgi:hypothetical protein